VNSNSTFVLKFFSKNLKINNLHDMIHKTLRKILPFFCLLPHFSLSAQNNLKIGEWRNHLPYFNGISVTQSDADVFWATGLAVLQMNKTDLTIEKLDKLNRLSDIGAKLVRYNRSTKTLLVAYENNNLDLVRTEGGKTANLPDIKNNNNILGDKTIYDASFVGDTALLACGFGISRLDMRRGEFITTTFTKLKTYSVVLFNGRIWAATEGGIYSVANDARLNLADFRIWQKAEIGFPTTYSSRSLAVFDGKLYGDVNDTLCVFQNNTPLSIRHENGHILRRLTAESQNLMAVFANKDIYGQGKLLTLSKTGQLTGQKALCINRPTDAVEDAAGRIWYADEYDAFRFLQRSTDAVCSAKSFESPYSRESSQIAATDTSVWVAYGGLSGINPRDNILGFGGWVGNGNWLNFNRLTQKALVDSSIIADFHSIAIHPLNGKIYAGSVQNGLVEITGNRISKIYNSTNSAIQNSTPDPGRKRVTGLAFDKKGNLWVANNLANRPIIVLKADGKWAQMGVVPASNIFQIIVDALGFKWYIVSGSQSGILVYDEGKNIDDTGDDRSRLIDNSNFPKELQSARINCLASDLQGSVWVGTSNGVGVFDGDPFRNNLTGRVIVNSLGGISEYLLREKNVTVIAVDGGNRKWIGTSTGLFVTSPDGREELFKFNVDNSPLPSNNITALGIRPNGEVFIGTDKGLVSYKGEATEGGDLNDVSKILAYPNPVRPGYEGPIAIKGFARDANIKIADAKGQIVFETRALGGQAIWDGRDLKGQRVATGVYLVLATNTRNLDAPDAVVTKILVVQ
jgi:ligand-binding sensor domain-containing protein